MMLPAPYSLGSVLDLGKAVAMLLGNGGDPMDYLEVVGRGQPVARSAVPYLALPTTAGTRRGNGRLSTSVIVAHTLAMSSCATVRAGVIFRTLGSYWQKPASTG